MQRSRCFYISTPVWVVYYWNLCFVTKPGRTLTRNTLLVTQVKSFLSSRCSSLQIYHKERRTRIPQSQMKHMTKVSSVRQINFTRIVRIQKTIHLETANMLLMIYAHARMSGDVTLIQKHVGIFSA